MLPDASPAQKVDAPVVRDPEQPGRQGALAVVGVELPICVKERVLDDVLAVQDGARHAGAVPVQARPQARDGLEKRDISGLEQSGRAGGARSVHVSNYAAGRAQDTGNASSPDRLAIARVAHVARSGRLSHPIRGDERAGATVDGRVARENTAPSSTELIEEDVRRDERGQEEDRIDDERPGVTDGKMREARRDERDGESEIRERTDARRVRAAS